MAKKRYPASFLKRLQAVVGKRSRTVVDHILAHGFVSTEDLKETYGYDHPPRAVRDVREQGIPIETFSIVGKHGRKIAAYRFGDPSSVCGRTQVGRKTIPKNLKQELLKLHGPRCAICAGTFSATQLQIDHRVPYEVAGDPDDSKAADHSLMLLCGSCNRAKSWSCEHCANWLEARDARRCRTCYWASPDTYSHIALEDTRRVDVVWQGADEQRDHADVAEAASAIGKPLPQFVKEVLRSNLTRDKNGERDRS